jgi:hypothetical protein
MILSLPFASNPWIFGGFESPVQLKGVCSIFVALDSSLPLGKRNNAASRAQKKKPLMAENRVSPHHPQQNIDRNDWFVVGVVTPPQCLSNIDRHGTSPPNMPSQSFDPFLPDH